MRRNLMRATTIDFLGKACGAELKGDGSYPVRNVKIDSRDCKDGDLFVCVVGEINNGHRFARSAYDLGCRAFLVSEDIDVPDDACILKVKDTNEAVKEMAAAYLAQFDVKKLAVTGSVGKTSTKMLTAAVMSAKYNTLCTQKNLNTHLGMCLTCFLADETTQCIVFEMGMDKAGEISSYVSWVKPELAIITNVGISHLERLGSRDAIADAKLEITEQFGDENVLVVNARSDYLKTEEEIRARSRSKADYKIVRVGEDIDYSDFRACGTDGIAFKINGVDFTLPLLGEHNALDATLAAAAGLEYGISLEEASAALAGVAATERRLKAEEIGGILLLDDSYNASPDSMKAGLSALAALPAKRHIAVLGDMLELGGAEESGHMEVGRFAAEHGVDIFITTGAHKEYYFRGISEAKNCTMSTLSFNDLDSLKDMVLQVIKPGDAVLVKGSNSTKFGTVAELIRNSERKDG